MRRFGLFQIGGFGFALVLKQIKKILQNSKAYGLPHLPGAVTAVLVDDGKLVPLLDLSLVIGSESRLKDDVPGYQVLVESQYGPIALAVDLAGKIVSEQKGELSVTVEQTTDYGVAGKFIYQGKEYKLLDVDFLAIEMTQGFLAKPA